MKIKRDQNLTRRDFMRGTAGAVAAFTFVSCHVLDQNGTQPPSDKLNIAAIGVGGMGASNINQCSTENIVALCDVDDKYAAGTYQKYPKAVKYKDFRVMLDKEDKNIDAVTISTPDHTHAIAAMMAIKMDKHVYCQKPLAHDIYEVRQLTKAARKHKVMTQMGIHVHAEETVKLVVEIIKSGMIGQVQKVDIWSDFGIYRISCMDNSISIWRTDIHTTYG